MKASRHEPTEGRAAQRVDAPAAVPDSVESHEPLRALRKDGLYRRMLPMVAAAVGGVVVLYLTGVFHSLHVFVASTIVISGLAGAMFLVPWERLPKWLEVAPPLGFVLLIAWIRENASHGAATVAITPMYLFTLLGVAIHGTRAELAVSIMVVCFLNFGIGVARGFHDGELAYLVLTSTVWSAVLGVANSYVASTREGAQALRRVLDSLPVGFAVLRGSDRRVVYTNFAVEGLLGSPDMPLLGRSAEALLPPEDRPGMVERVDRILDGGFLPPTDRRIVRANGDEVVLEATAVGIRFEGVPAVGAVFRDVTDERRFAAIEVAAKTRTEGERARLESILSAVRDGVVIIGRDGRGLYANPAYCELFGIDRTRIPGLSREEFIDHVSSLVEEPEGFRQAIVQNADSDAHSVETFVLVRPTHRVVRRERQPLELPDGSGFLIVWYDITAVHALMAERERQAETDPLTGLANRRGAFTALERELSRAQRTSAPLSVALFDIDRFKKVNDIHGHDVGDRVLVAVAAALRDTARATDLVARWGGEEFLAILPGDAEAARAFGERVRGTLATLRLAPVDSITTSVGIATIGVDETYESAIKRADERLYEAKRAGRNRVV